MNNSQQIAPIAPLQEQMGCSTVVHESVCVQGTVTITPNVVSGPSRSFCIGNPVIGRCQGELEPNCTFTVSQNICVQIPLTFSAVATAVPNGVVCGTPRPTPCPGTVTGCTFTIGYFRNHPEDTNALIEAAGGSITLGEGGGLSFVVTTANANDVLVFNVPSPPAPADPPFANQYQVLYAQLFLCICSFHKLWYYLLLPREHSFYKNIVLTLFHVEGCLSKPLFSPCNNEFCASHN